MNTGFGADLRRARASSSSGLAGLVSVRMVATALYRLAHAVGARVPVLASMIKQLNHLLTGADIAWQASIGPGLALFHPTGVVIGPHVRIGANCAIQQGVTLGGRGGDDAKSEEFPTLGSDVSLGAGARVVGGVHVGDGAQIGANAVVVSDVPAHTVAVGVPAKVREVRNKALPEEDA